MDEGDPVVGESFENAYVKDTKRCLLRLENAANTGIGEIVEGISELSVLCWLGGPAVQIPVGTSHIVDRFHEWLQGRALPIDNLTDDQVFALHRAVLEVVSIVCRRSKPIQDRLKQSLWIEVLVKFLSHPRDKLRQLAVTCLLFIIINNTANQFAIMKVHGIQGAIENICNLDWSLHVSNHADDLLNLLDLAQHAIRKDGAGNESLLILMQQLSRQG